MVPRIGQSRLPGFTGGRLPNISHAREGDYMKIIRDSHSKTWGTGDLRSFGRLWTQLAKLVGLSLLLIAMESSHAAGWLLLGRGATVRGALGRTIAADFSWLGREVSKAVIEQAIASNSAMQQDLEQSQCLVVEFDGYRNHIGNFCNYSISFNQLVLGSGHGQAITSSCAGCSVQPGQILTLTSGSGSVVGPALAIAQETHSAAPRGEIQSEPSLNNSAELQTRVIRSSYGNLRASVILEITNPSPLAVGIVAETRSIWGMARASIHNQCGSEYQQGPPYDSLAGISKSPANPTWIPPQGSIRVSYNPNSLRGGSQECALSHVTIDVQVFRSGVRTGQPTTLFADIK